LDLLKLKHDVHANVYLMRLKFVIVDSLKKCSQKKWRSNNIASGTHKKGTRLDKPGSF